MKIVLASDHAGFELKEHIKSYLSNYDILDYGTNSEDSMDYPDTGFKASEAVSKGDCEKGILVCGSGIGMSIVANKVPGIRAALCQTKEFAELSRKHNDSNILVLSGRFISRYLALGIIDVWLNTDFENGRHQTRIDKIKLYENKET